MDKNRITKLENLKDIGGLITNDILELINTEQANFFSIYTGKIKKSEEIVVYFETQKTKELLMRLPFSENILISLLETDKIKGITNGNIVHAYFNTETIGEKNSKYKPRKKALEEAGLWQNGI